MTARSGFALTATIAINLALFAGLSALNAPGDPPPEPERPLRVAVVEDPPVPPLPLRQEPAAPTDAPDPSPPDPDPAPLDLPDLPLDFPAALALPVYGTAPLPADRSPAGRDSEGDAPLGAAAVDVPPRELSVAEPEYPRAAMRQGLEGSVTVRLVIDASGRVLTSEVLEVMGHPGFARAVLDVAPGWRFVPAEHRGRAVAVVATKTIGFRLEDD